MRRQDPVAPVIGTYRLVFIGVGILMLIMVGITVAEAMEFGLENRPIEFIAARVGVGVTLLLLLRWGYQQLKQQLIRADNEQRKLLDSAYEDALTGAFTRSYFFDQLRSKLHGNDRPVAYMQIDMDNLKVLNDAHGHGAGDTALVHLVKTLKALMPDALVGRLGGDEFGIVMRHGAATAAEVLAARIVDAVRQPLTLADGEAVGVRVCIGIAAYTDEVESAAALQAQAELALDAARREYDHRWSFFGRKFDGAALRLVETAAAVPDPDPSTSG